MAVPLEEWGSNLSNKAVFAIGGVLFIALIVFVLLIYVGKQFPTRNERDGAWLWNSRIHAKKEAFGRLEIARQVSDEKTVKRLIEEERGFIRELIPEDQRAGEQRITRGAIVPKAEKKPDYGQLNLKKSI